MLLSFPTFSGKCEQRIKEVYFNSYLTKMNTVQKKSEMEDF